MKFLFAISCTLVYGTLKAQPKYNASLLDTLQQIAQSNTPAKYFAQLYYKAIEKTNDYADSKPDSVKAFIFGFESLFAPVFFQSYQNYITKQPQIFAWQRYYADTSLNELQYHFMGMNAHINGDMWLALKDKYCYDTLKKYRGFLLQFQKVMNTYFDSIYVSTANYKKMRRLHLFTLGFDKFMGRRMILHWRKRQEHMAMLFYSDPRKCERTWQRLQKKMTRYDRFALQWIQ